MNLGELAAFIDTHLREKGINVVLSGGASVAIYSDHKYVSKDLDFIGRYSIDLEDLRLPPANRLEKLKGDREGQHSIRINKQWRICFEWSDGDAYKVEITDYH